MQIKVTTSIDPFLKSSFEATKSLHNKSFSEVLEEGIKKILEDVSPLESVQLAISQREQELSDLRSKCAELELLERQKKLQKKSEPEEDPQMQEYLEQFRQEKFEKTKISNLRLWNKGDIDWSRIVSVYKFPNKKEAQDWFAQRVAQEEFVV